MVTVTMGELLQWRPPLEDEVAYDNLISTLDTLYPPDWTSWTIRFLNYIEIFGETLTPDIARLRFAVPTAMLAQIFGIQNYLSESQYEAIKRKLLEWPIGQTIIYQPSTIMVKTHLSTGAYNKFLDVLPKLRVGFLSSEEASQHLRMLSERNSSYESRGTPERSAILTLDTSVNRTNITNEPITRHLETQAENVLFQNEMVVQPYTGAWKAPPLVNEEEPQLQDEQLLNFAPGTKESEAKISKADDMLAAQGIHCQKLESEGWSNIRYADVQKLFQATPVFTSLKVNGNLATVTPSRRFVSTLEKMDLCLGAISHGLLQQHKAFEEICLKVSPDVKTHICNKFLSTDSSFRNISEKLLQYTCGKRAELLGQRRALYKPQKKTIRELLHAIPPSRTHLFSEPELSDLVKQQGGIGKIFPGKFRKSTSSNWPKRSSNKDRRPTEKNRQASDFQRFREPERKTPRTARRRTTTENKKSRYDGRKY